LTLALAWLLGPAALLILGLMHLHKHSCLQWWRAIAWTGALAIGMAVEVVILHGFGLLFWSYPKDFDGTPLGPSRFAPARPRRTGRRSSPQAVNSR
jgi:hypothetical protein